MITVEWQGIEQMELALLAYEKDMRDRARLACAEVARWLEAYAQTHHPWVLLTGATNVTTHGTWEEVADDLYEVVISAGMFYDVFLETGAKQYETFIGYGGVMQTKWSWLWPTLISQRDAIMATFARHMRV